MQSLQSFRGAYAGLLIIRACFAIFGTGYIHPDEYFQNGDVTAGRIFGFHELRTWEWDPSFPVRSIMPPFLTTGIPFLLAKLVLNEQSLSPSFVFRLERLVFFGISLLLDHSVSVLVHNPESRRYALLLSASSHVMHTFQMRPFSNSIEAVLVAMSFVALRNFVAECPINYDKVPKSNVHLHILAVLFVIGTFTRVTFVAFALPIGWQLLGQVFLPTSIRLQTSPWHNQALTLLLPALMAALISLAIILTDTYYFRGNFSALVVTPLNFLSYNLSSRNLAEHGIHPRWLHLFVNLPTMVSPPLLWLAVRAGIQHWQIPAEKRAHANQVLDRTTVYVFLFAITMLSIQPHQEPRFLSPLLVLFVVFVANSGNLLRAGRIFWGTWIIFNILVASIFGVLHQGGVVPSLFHLHDRISAVDFIDNATHIIYWKTYMPPRHLLAIEGREISSGRIHLTDLAGDSSSSLYQTILYPSTSFFNKSDVPSYSKETTFLVTPFPMKSSLPPKMTACFVLDHRVFPHLDLDHIGESVEAGWRDGLSLGIWRVDKDCMSNTNLELD